jgi:Protein of unknown function (DUF3349)
MPLPPFLAAVVGWLRAGYPEGVPEVDYIPLFALLGSQLTDSEIGSIADELASDGDRRRRRPSRRRSAPSRNRSRWSRTSPGSGPGSRRADGR